MSFCIIGLCLSGVSKIIFTGPAVSYVGADPVFTCQTGDDIMSVQWLLNGTLDDGLNMNVVFDFSQTSHVGSLLIRDVPMEYNGTTIQCRANSSSGSITYSNITTMIIQGWLIIHACMIKKIMLNKKAI